MAQKAEHEYAGVMCGIMDQFASIFGKEDHLIRLDCRDHSYEYFRFEQDDYQIVLCDTGLKHQLASSEYNLRRRECEKGVQILKQIDPTIHSLRDANPELLRKYKDLFGPVIYKRCLYVVEENKRVIDACDHLQKGELDKFGSLMYKTHDGLQNLYEVSCKELDVLVDATRNLDYVLGSRLMGGGFGGCTINLTQKSYYEKFIDAVSNYYKNAMDTAPKFYRIEICDGATEL
jgi:galactokinase